MAGKHLTPEKRFQIETLYKFHASAREIAEQVGCSTRTVYRELRLARCQQLDGQTYRTYEIYSSQISDRIHAERASNKGGRLKLLDDPALVEFLVEYIGRRKYSPAAALAEIQIQGLRFSVSVSAKSVYRYIDRGLLGLTRKDLPVGGYNIKKNEDKEKRVNQRHILDKSISDRPAEVAKRQVMGYWEMDTVVGQREGQNKCLLVLTERKTRYELVFPLRGKTAREVCSRLDELRRTNPNSYGKVFKGIFCDNGGEFAYCQQMERLAPVYYCHPYNAWERGSNENQNKLIRRFSPKGRSMNRLKDEEVEYIQLWMNNYPRKLLGWQRPADLFAQELQKIGVESFSA